MDMMVCSLASDDSASRAIAWWRRSWSLRPASPHSCVRLRQAPRPPNDSAASWDRAHVPRPGADQVLLRRGRTQLACPVEQPLHCARRGDVERDRTQAELVISDRDVERFRGDVDVPQPQVPDLASASGGVGCQQRRPERHAPFPARAGDREQLEFLLCAECPADVLALGQWLVILAREVSQREVTVALFDPRLLVVR